VNAWDDEIRNLNALLASDKGMRVALTSILALQKKRIFQNGQAADNSKIGTYGTKSASISKKQQAKNTGHTYFKGGYSQYKSEIGKNPGFVILRNTDQMMMDYGMFVLGNNQWGLGYGNDTNFDKSQWMEDKYKKDIFDQTDQEDQTLESILNSALERYL
jgi:hypothetical protein